MQQPKPSVWGQLIYPNGEEQPYLTYGAELRYVPFAAAVHDRPAGGDAGG